MTRSSDMLDGLADVHATATIGGQMQVDGSARIGPGCRITGPGRIGHEATFEAGIVLDGPVEIGGGARLEAGVTTIPGVDDSKPLRIGDDSQIGAGAVLTQGITIGRHARVRAGAHVVHDVPAHAIVAGEPAHVVGFMVPKPAERISKLFSGIGAVETSACSVRGVELYRFPRIGDARGELTFTELGGDFPFTARRYFAVYDVPQGAIRGGHTHTSNREFLICLKGEIAVVVDDGDTREEIILDAPCYGLYLPELVWATQYKHSADAVLLVFNSQHYNAKGYIRDYETFLERRRG